jgi:uncharacterized membrane protein YqiK
MVRVDLPTITLNIPPQQVITKDNVPAKVNAVAEPRHESNRVLKPLRTHAVRRRPQR